MAFDADGNKIVTQKREKGVDVLCALATVREAQDAANDLVILASSDTDLAPAIDEVQRLGYAKIETFCWYDSVSRIGYQLHPTDRTRRPPRGAPQTSTPSCFRPSATTTATAPGHANRPHQRQRARHPHLCRSQALRAAEDGGFEPPRAFTQHAFQACAIGH